MVQSQLLVLFDQVLRLVYCLVKFGHYGNIDDMKQLLDPMLSLLNGRNDKLYPNVEGKYLTSTSRIERQAYGRVVYSVYLCTQQYRVRRRYEKPIKFGWFLPNILYCRICGNITACTKVYRQYGSPIAPDDYLHYSMS